MIFVCGSVVFVCAKIFEMSAVPLEKGEDAEFPIACETCLGPEPDIRMLRAPLDKECKICC